MSPELILVAAFVAGLSTWFTLRGAFIGNWWNWFRAFALAALVFPSVTQANDDIRDMDTRVTLTRPIGTGYEFYWYTRYDGVKFYRASATIYGTSGSCEVYPASGSDRVSVGTVTYSIERLADGQIKFTSSLAGDTKVTTGTWDASTIFNHLHAVPGFTNMNIGIAQIAYWDLPSNGTGSGGPTTTRAEDATTQPIDFSENDGRHPAGIEEGFGQHWEAFVGNGEYLLPQGEWRDLFYDVRNMLTTPWSAGSATSAIEGRLFDCIPEVMATKLGLTRNEIASAICSGWFAGVAMLGTAAPLIRGIILFCFGLFMIYRCVIWCGIALGIIQYVEVIQQ